MAAFQWTLVFPTFHFSHLPYSQFLNMLYFYSSVNDRQLITAYPAHDCTTAQMPEKGLQARHLRMRLLQMRKELGASESVPASTKLCQAYRKRFPPHPTLLRKVRKHDITQTSQTDTHGCLYWNEFSRTSFLCLEESYLRGPSGCSGPWFSCCAHLAQCDQPLRGTWQLFLKVKSGINTQLSLTVVNSKNLLEKAKIWHIWMDC